MHGTLSLWCDVIALRSYQKQSCNGDISSTCAISSKHDCCSKTKAILVKMPLIRISSSHPLISQYATGGQYSLVLIQITLLYYHKMHSLCNKSYIHFLCHEKNTRQKMLLIVLNIATNKRGYPHNIFLISE